MSFEMVPSVQRLPTSRHSGALRIQVDDAVPFDPTLLRCHYLNQSSRQLHSHSIGTHDPESAPLVVRGDSARPACLQAAVYFGAFGVSLLFALLIGLIGATYYNITGSIQTAMVLMLPHVEELTNYTKSTLRHADETATLASGMMSDGKLLSSSALPTMLDALNRSQHMVDQLERIAAHPTVKVSLSGD